MQDNFNASKAELLHKIPFNKESNKSSNVNNNSKKFENFIKFTRIDEIINELIIDEIHELSEVKLNLRNRKKSKAINNIKVPIAQSIALFMQPPLNFPY